MSIKKETKIDQEQSSLQQMLSSTSRLAEIEPREIDQYNEKLDQFFVESAHYFKELAFFHRWETLTAPLSFFLVNDGSAPADDIDIFMHFPDGFDLLEEHEYKQTPATPKAPSKPKSILDLAIGGLAAPSFRYGNDHLFPDPSHFRVPTGPANVGGPRIKRTNSYDVKVHVRRAKHGIEVALDKMFVTFASSNAIRGFAIDYEIHASNLPVHVSGRLNIAVQPSS